MREKNRDSDGPQERGNQQAMAVRSGETGGVDFIIIGAMKSGTTTLYQYLCRHPRIFMVTPKEPQFFSMRYDPKEGWDRYRRLFDAAKPSQLRGEASTCYTRWPAHGDVAGRIASHLPSVRLIYLMRHPVERAYSHYAHRMQEWIANGKEPIGIEQALEQLPEIVDSSLYLTQVDRYLKHFPPQQLLAVTLDDMVADPAGLLARVQRFLGLEVVDLAAGARVAANPKGQLHAEARRRQMLRAMSTNPQLAAVRRLLPKWARSALRERILDSLPAKKLMLLLTRSTLKRRLAPLTDETRIRLLERFAEPNRRLESFLGRSLPEWAE